MRSLAHHWGTHLASHWPDLAQYIEGRDRAELRTLLTWLYVLALEADSKDLDLTPAERYDLASHHKRFYGSLFSGIENRVGLIKSRVSRNIGVKLESWDAEQVERLIRDGTNE